MRGQKPASDGSNHRSVGAPRLLKDIVLASIVSAIVGAGAATVAGHGNYGDMPDSWAQQARVYVNGRSSGDFLGEVVGVVQNSDMTSGSVQGRETYLYLNGDTMYATNSPRNTEVARGRHRNIRNGGGVISGPGLVDDWTIYGERVVIKPQSGGRILRVHGIGFGAVAGADQTWGVDFPDPLVQHHLAGRTYVGELVFPNGWVLRARGDTLEIQDTHGLVHVIR